MKDRLHFIPHKNHQRFAWIFLVGSFDIHGPSTDQVSEIYLLVSEPVDVCSLDHNNEMIVEEKVSQITMVQGLTDLKETFKLNGDASLSLLRVELNHASFVSAASFS